MTVIFPMILSSVEQRTDSWVFTCAQRKKIALTQMSLIQHDCQFVSSPIHRMEPGFNLGWNLGSNPGFKPGFNFIFRGWRACKLWV